MVVARNGKKAAISSGAIAQSLHRAQNQLIELAWQIKGKMIEVYTIRDAKEPRKALDAIEEEASVAHRI